MEGKIKNTPSHDEEKARQIKALEIINRNRISDGKKPVSSLAELEGVYKQEGLMK